MVSDNVLYVGTLQGKLVALDLTSASLPEGFAPELKWDPKDVAESTGSNFSCGRVNNPMALYGTPATANGRVYVGAYDGSVLWVAIDGSAVSDPKFDTGAPIVGSLAIASDTLFVGNSKGTLYATDLNLSEKWRFKTRGEIFSTPVVTDNVVYVASADHNLYALDAQSGKEIWRFETKAAIMSTPLVANGKVYIGGCDRRFHMIEAAREEERVAAAGGASATVRQSEAVFEGAANWFWTQALLYNGQIWVGCLDKNVYVLDANNLAYVGEIRTKGMVYAPPIMVKGLVTVGSGDGMLYLINPDTREFEAYAIDPKEHVAVKAPEKPKNSPAPILASMFADGANGVVYLHAQDGNHILYAFELSSKEVLWYYRTDKIS